MPEFGKLNFAVSFNPQTAFPLDARYYFSSLEAAKLAASSSVEVGSSDGTYFYGETICVVSGGSADLYIIQPNKSLKAVGSAVLGDGKSIEVIDGKVSIRGFSEATAGQQPRINSSGNGIEWYTPDTSTVSGLSETVAGHTTDISNLQKNKADKATTLAGYGITDAMTTDAVNSAIQSAIAKTGHASFQKVSSIPSADTAEENILYLVMNGDTGFYDIYAKVDAEVIRLDDTSVNLENYPTNSDMQKSIEAAVAGKVDTVPGKGLSSNDYTDEDAEKLASISPNAEKNYIRSVNESEFSVSVDGLLAVASVSIDKISGLNDALRKKVDSVPGKTLSTNDFTDDDKNKLDSLDPSAIQTMQSDINAVKLSVVWGEI